MDQERKSPVEIVQKLIAINTTRKEVCERILKSNHLDDMQSKLQTVKAQSDKFINGLLSELSQFGDAVQSEVNRDDEFHEIWNKSMSNIDVANNSLLETFKESESVLLNIYSDTLEEYPDLPVTLQDLLKTQVQEIKQIQL